MAFTRDIVMKSKKEDLLSTKDNKQRFIRMLDQSVLGRAVCNNMVFVHAILGCDTTYRVFSMGKGLALKHIRSDNHFITQAEIVLQENATLADISSAGEAALVCLYTLYIH